MEITYLGQIRVTIAGSFNSTGNHTFEAIYTGHADCVAQAIEFLSSEVLPRAIKQDHQLHTEGHSPQEGFGRWQEK